MSLWAVPVRRPVATAMVFVGVALLGLIASQRIAIELLPSVGGDTLFVSIARPGSDPEIVEREVLLPLEARVGELPGVHETQGRITAAGGQLQIEFAAGTDLDVRELELRRIAAELTRTQPAGTVIDVQSFDTSTLSRFVMVLQVVGGADRDRLLDFVEERIAPRLLAASGVSQVRAFGGAPREVTVRIDPDRAAAENVPVTAISTALRRAVGRQAYLGGAESSTTRTAVVLDGRPAGIVSLGRIRVDPARQVELRHVAEVAYAVGEEQSEFRIDGRPSVAIAVFQEEGANLVRLGRDLRARLADLREEYREFGIDFVTSFDAAEVVETQVERLQRLALTGFAIALIVLFVFLRQWRAVAVVAIAVPTSLLAALALLYFSGQTLNMITLVGLAIGVGMLVDNSIVVYESVQRGLEHGAGAEEAAVGGVRRTVRAIVAASATNAVVFLPALFVQFDNALVRSLLEVFALAILFPLAGSLLVAVGLVPLLARWLAAPAAIRRIERVRAWRAARGGLRPPDRLRDVFSGVLTVALRRPSGWVAVVVLAVIVTVVIALPFVAVGTLAQDAAEADEVRIAVTLDGGGSLDHARGVFARLEAAVAELEGVDRVESLIREDSGTLTVHLVDADERPKGFGAGRIRSAVREAARGLPDVEVESQGAGAGGGGGGLAGLLGQGSETVRISGPDAGRLESIAGELEAQLEESVPEIADARVSTERGRDELRVTPDALALQAFGLTADQVLPVLSVVRREGVLMQIGFTLPDGREIPLTVRRTEDAARGGDALRRLRVPTAGVALPLEALTTVRTMPPPPVISHKDGRREIEVSYRYGPEAPSTGPARLALDEQVRDAIRAVNRPAGYTIEAADPDESFSWFRAVLVPVVLLLFAVLAVTFESLTLPLLVLLTLPLTLLGAVWALVFAGMPADTMALVGALVLVGLTVNPAILLVDRMQQRIRAGGGSPAAAALAAVRERARPVLMTTTTTVAGLWPLALVTGRENEIWPPFATIVMGGLLTSTLLTLFVIPVGFVALVRLDRLFGRLGPWILLGWAASVTAVVTPLFVTGTVSSTTWRLLTTLLIGALALGAAVLWFRRPERPRPVEGESGAPALDVRHLRKVYGRPGPVGRAWRAPQRFARRVLRQGGLAYDRAGARERIVPLVLAAIGSVYLAQAVGSTFWRIVYAFVAAALAVRAARELRRARGRVDELGRATPGGPEALVGVLLPWLALAWIGWRATLGPWLADEPRDLSPWWIAILALGLLLVQLGRRTAVRLASGRLRPSASGRFAQPRTLWRTLSRRLFGLDLPREEVRALAAVQFRVERGMVGILGPNGAGKTTLLRQLAGILDPSAGRITIGGVPLGALRRFLARWVGYLPQEFGLPGDLTAREYLDYYALLYELGSPSLRRERVDRLLDEVGLGTRADEKIGGYSGGMKQRVAVARTLLRLPPVIIVDEPTVGLDPRERIRFRNLLSRLAEGRIVLFSTHVVEDVAVACERVLVLAAGRLVFDGAPGGLVDAARGRVWELRTPLGSIAAELASGAIVVDEVPELDGVRRRVLAAERPHADAVPGEPSLEDGYMWLVGTGTAVAGAVRSE